MSARKTIRVATYNVLAQSYLRREWYQNSPAEALDPSARLEALTRRLIELDADILCLQEVEGPVFSALEGALAPRGYAGSFLQKGRGKPDGCATFLREARLELERRGGIVYLDGDPPSGHVAQVAATRFAGSLLGVIDTHVRWDQPDKAPAEHVGCRQARQLIAEHRQLFPGCRGWVVAGDFNATPDSDVVAAMLAGGFRSAHPSDLATCNANNKAKLIDYLFVSERLGASPLAPPKIDGDTPLPGPGEPSDHLPLVAELWWE